MFKDKGLIIGILITVLLIGGGVYYFSGSPSSTSPSSTPVSQNMLIPKDDYITSGYSNGTYLPASESARVTIVEFGDYECPACGQYHPLIKQLLNEFAGKVNFVFRNFPLSQHKNAQIASQAVEAAGLQNKYWQMHDKVYESQNEWATSSDAKSIFVGYAQTLGLNVDQYKTDIESSKVKAKISADVNDGGLIKIDATPTYYLNGLKMETLPQSYSNLKQLVSDKINAN